MLVCIGMSDAEVMREVEQRHIALTESDRKELSDPPQSAGSTIMLDGNQTVLRLQVWDETPQRHGQLAHEILHAVAMLFDRIGMKLSRHTDEAYAYAIEHLTVAILTRLAPQKRKRA